MGSNTGRRVQRLLLYGAVGFLALVALAYYNTIGELEVITRATRAPTTAPPEVPLTPLERNLQALNATLHCKFNLLAEQKLRTMLDTRMSHAIGPRYPLPAIPLILTAVGDKCLVGKACEEARKSPSRWNPDMHVRDIVISLMLECALPWGPHTKEPCVAHDVGANIGLIAHTMALMGAHVVAVEPQVDLCLALRATLEAKGEARKHVILCGGVGKEGSERMRTSTGLYRYEGKVPQSVADAYPPTVPVYNVKQLLGNFTRKLKFAKIDTDSHDCLILEQYLVLIEQKKLEVESLILETWDWSCLGGRIGELLYRFQVVGYHVYRTLTPRDFDDNGFDTRNQFKPLADAPPAATEQYHQRQIRHTFKMHARSQQEWVALVQQKDQLNRIYFVTTATIYEQGYISA